MIEILMATYDSSEYLKEVLDSIVSQSYRDWRLVLSDGGSTDQTSQIITEYIERFPDQISCLDPAGRMNACENFSRLLSASSSRYVMFADHDDVWLPNKVQVEYQAMLVAEEQSGSDTPVLVFTDKVVVDSELNIICDSYFKYQHLDPNRTELRFLLTQNVASGCTMMLNRALIDLCGTIPAGAVMHDHWLSLLASANGRIVCHPEATILYRQHGGNVYGANRYGLRFIWRRFQTGRTALRGRFLQNVHQTACFAEMYREQLSAEHRALVEAFASWPSLGWFARRRMLWRHRIFKTGILRNLGMFLWL
jgi:glycosyltransferase involved in cell wall biosynthesis